VDVTSRRTPMTAGTLSPTRSCTSAQRRLGRGPARGGWAPTPGPAARLRGRTGSPSWRWSAARRRRDAASSLLDHLSTRDAASPCRRCLDQKKAMRATCAW
jgi:hypothetical protein